MAGVGQVRITFFPVFPDVTVVRVVPGTGLNPLARLSGRLLAVVCSRGSRNADPILPESASVPPGQAFDILSKGVAYCGPAFAPLRSPPQGGPPGSGPSPSHLRTLPASDPIFPCIFAGMEIFFLWNGHDTSWDNVIP